MIKLFYGDSLTDGSSYPDYVVNTLNRLCPKADFEILNAAVAGNTAADLRKRLAVRPPARLPSQRGSRGGDHEEG